MYKFSSHFRQSIAALFIYNSCTVLWILCSSVLLRLIIWTGDPFSLTLRNVQAALILSQYCSGVVVWRALLLVVFERCSVVHFFMFKELRCLPHWLQLRLLSLLLYVVRRSSRSSCIILFDELAELLLLLIFWPVLVCVFIVRSEVLWAVEIRRELLVLWHFFLHHRLDIFIDGKAVHASHCE